MGSLSVCLRYCSEGAYGGPFSVYGVWHGHGLDRLHMGTDRCRESNKVRSRSMVCGSTCGVQQETNRVLCCSLSGNYTLNLSTVGIREKQSGLIPLSMGTHICRDNNNGVNSTADAGLYTRLVGWVYVPVVRATFAPWSRAGY